MLARGGADSRGTPQGGCPSCVERAREASGNCQGGGGTWGGGFSSWQPGLLGHWVLVGGRLGVGPACLGPRGELTLAQPTRSPAGSQLSRELGVAHGQAGRVPNPSCSVPGVSCAVVRALRACAKLWSPGHLLGVSWASGVCVPLWSCASGCVLGVNTHPLGVRCEYPAVNSTGFRAPPSGLGCPLRVCLPQGVGCRGPEGSSPVPPGCEP